MWMLKLEEDAAEKRATVAYVGRAIYRIFGEHGGKFEQRAGQGNEKE